VFEIRYYSAAAQVDKGKKRENNEDNLYFDGIFLTEETREQPVCYENKPDNKIQIYAVCDGMGGEQSGETASLLVVQTIHKYADELQNASAEKADEIISRCMDEANSLICNAKKESGSGRIGTTLALTVFINNAAFLYNVGDSRIYLLRKFFFRKKLTQLSEDHTAVMHLIKYGMMTAEEAKNHPRRNALTQHIGIEPDEMIIEPFKKFMKTKRGDVFLLCSDGVTDALEDFEISEILSKNKNPSAAASLLVDLSMERGGKDNITVIVVRVV
jgi:protein phosphatase